MPPTPMEPAANIPPMALMTIARITPTTTTTIV